MQSLSLLCVASLTLGLVSFAETASADVQLLENGGFETGDFTGWTLSGNPSLKSVSPTYPHSGIYAADVSTIINRFGSYSFLSQNLATTDFASSTYDLSFSIANDSDGTSAGGGDGSGVLTQFTVTWGGTTLLDLINEGAFGYRTYSFSGLTASSATTNLEFGFKQLGASWHLDDTSVERAASATVPEPAAIAVWCLLGGWGAGVTFLSKRRSFQRLPSSTSPPNQTGLLG